MPPIPGLVGAKKMDKLDTESKLFVNIFFILALISICPIVTTIANILVFFTGLTIIYIFPISISL